MFSRAKVSDTERLASIEADILALQARLRGFEQAAIEAAEAAQQGLILSRDARMQQEFSELMAGVTREQIEEQWKARDALCPKQREASSDS